MFRTAGSTLERRGLYTLIAIPAFFLLGSGRLASAQEDNTQTVKLYQLQAAYHRAATVRNPVNGDSPDTIAVRLREVLSLFTADAVRYLTVGNATFDGYYRGKGDPDNASTCPPPSADANNRGTVCTFYKYLQPGFSGDQQACGADTVVQRIL